MSEKQKTAGVSVLFVCLGNICRSPTAQGMFESVLLERAPRLDVFVDSAGTHAYHVGEPPDPRSQRAAIRRGVDLSAQRARAVESADFASFDWIIAMDEDNYRTLLGRCPTAYRQRVRKFMSFAPQSGHSNVPDPYYGGERGFETVLDLTRSASLGLLEAILEARPPAR